MTVDARHATAAKCDGCEWEDNSAEAVGLAGEHAAETGHAVRARKATLWKWAGETRPAEADEGDENGEEEEDGEEEG